MTTDFSSLSTSVSDIQDDFQAFQICSAIQNYKLSATLFASYGDIILICGQRRREQQSTLLLSYQIPSTTEALAVSIRLLRLVKLTKTCVTQLETIPNMNIVLLLADGIVSLLDIDTLSEITTIPVDNVTLFSTWYDITSSTSTLLTPNELRICIPIQPYSLRFYRWLPHQRRLEEVKDSRGNFELIDTPRAIACSRDKICVCYQESYVVMSLKTGLIINELPFNMKGDPIINFLQDRTQWCIQRNSNTVFLDTNFEPINESRIVWKDFPSAIIQTNPYVLALVNQSIDIRIFNGSQSVHIQQIPLKKVTPTDECHLWMDAHNGRIYVTTPTDILLLEPMSIQVQLKRYTDIHRYDLALIFIRAKLEITKPSSMHYQSRTIDGRAKGNLDISKMPQENTFENNEKTLYNSALSPQNLMTNFSLDEQTRNKIILWTEYYRIGTIYAFQLFHNEQFEQAFIEFNEFLTDPAEVVSLFGSLSASAWLTNSYINLRAYLRRNHQQFSEVDEKKLENALYGLEQYLADLRRVFRSTSATLLEVQSLTQNRLVLKPVHDLLSIVETALLKVYLINKNYTLANVLLRNQDNCCLSSVIEKELKNDPSRIKLLISFYRKQKRHADALKLMININSTISNNNILNYLSELNNDHLPLIFEYIRPIIKSTLEKPNNEDLLRNILILLIGDPTSPSMMDKNGSQIIKYDPTQVYAFLRDINQDFALQYLKHTGRKSEPYVEQQNILTNSNQLEVLPNVLEQLIGIDPQEQENDQDNMGIGKPSNLTAKRGDGTIFFQWSSVQDASAYEVHIDCPDSGERSIDQTTQICFTKHGLKNGLCYTAQIIAVNDESRGLPSEALKVMEEQSSFEFLAKLIKDTDQINLSWTIIPTSSYYRIERCDIGRENKFTCITTINDNQISTFQDQLNCGLSKVRCGGHCYRISLSDNTILSDKSRLSNRLFCKTKVDISQCIHPSTNGKSNSDCLRISATVPDHASSEQSNLEMEQDNSTDGMALLPDYINPPIIEKSRPLITVCKGDLTTQQTDVIVACSSSRYLLNAICKAGGDSMTNSFNIEAKKNPNTSLIAIKAEGQIASKKVYFLSWKTTSAVSDLSQSIKKFVSDAIEKAVEENYQSIAFPAIGCGQYGFPSNLIAQMMVEEAYEKIQNQSISVVFVIQPDKVDVHDEFQRQINLLKQPPKQVSIGINKGIVEVEMGDLTTQNVDVIVGSSSSNFLKEAIIVVGGDAVKTAYDTEYTNNPNAILISTPPGDLPCKRIFFVKWQPDQDETVLRQSLIDLISTVIQSVMSHNYTSLAFPSIGCGKHGCSVDVVVKTMVKEIKNQLTKRNVALTVKFVIQSDQQDVYEEFCKQVLLTPSGDTLQSINYQLPTIWEKSEEKKIRFKLSTTSDEYKSILTNFDQTMKGKYTQIIRIERIQNERWYIQYLAHSHNFKTRLNTDTEKCLYHGCPEQAATLIMEDCFNRSFAGVNGTLYGVGVYFSSHAAYSHTYTKGNANGERHMFLARVLVGDTTIGDSSMKIRPIGFDSTTDGNHIFVTYHDAQAYAEYLITYK